MIDQVGLGLEIARAARDESFEEIGVHGGAQDPEPVRVLLLDGDDEMRNLAIAQVDVADEDAFFHRGPEPEMVPVVARHQVVRPDVGAVVAFGIDDPQVGETGKLALQRAVGPPESAGVGEFRQTDVGRQQSEVGGPFGQELVDDGAVVLNLESQGFDGVGFQGVGRVDVDDAAQ